MSKDIYERIDTQEKKKIEIAAEIFSKKHEISLHDIFGNKTIEKELMSGPRLWTNSFPEAYETLPLNSIIYSKILNSICPSCTCTKEPSLLMPFLERGVVLPVLTAPLSQYPVEFAGLVIQYPYVGLETQRFLRFVRRYTSDEKGGICSDCYEKKWKQICDYVESLPVEKKTKNDLLTACRWTFQSLYPAQRPEVSLLLSFEECIKQREWNKLAPIADRADILSNLRNSQVFRAVPQVSQFDLDNIAQTLQNKYSFSTEISVEEKELALRALNIDYNPAMPIEEYLDIVLPRKQRINRLVEEILSSKKKEETFSKIEDEIWAINCEVSSSKAIECFSFTTNLVFDNARILSSMLLGAFVGYCSGNFTGCGLGSAGGLAIGSVAKKLSEKVNFKVRNYPRKTSEWLKSKMESPEEHIIAKILAKDIKTIQVWSLRKKLNRP
jgi:hypothetical protein